MERTEFAYYGKGGFDCIEQVVAFFRFLIRECGLDVDPYKPFGEYLNTDDDYYFDLEQSDIVDYLMDQSFEVCNAEEVGIYELIELVKCGDDSCYYA